MTRRTKQQIQIDKVNLLKDKKEALAKLISHLDGVSNLTEEQLSKVGVFIKLFLQCETVYKTLYPEMEKLKKEEQIDVRQLKFNVQKFETALRYFGISYDHEKMNKMFYARKSYLTCRDNIIHGLNMKSINEVLNNYDEMTATMQELLANVASAKPEESKGV